MRNNYVFLRGNLQQVTKTTILNPVDIIEVRFHVITGHRELGDHHLVVAYGKLAIDVLAAQKAELLPSECMIEGWLQSDDDHSWTVAQEVTMLLGRSQRKRLRWEIERLKMNILQVE